MNMRSNDDKLELFADVLEPFAALLADGEVTGVLSRNEPIIRAVSLAIKRHKAEVTEIFARLEGVEPEEYDFNPIRVTFKALQFFGRNDVQQMVRELFTSPEQNDVAASSGAAMEIIEGGAN